MKSIQKMIKLLEEKTNLNIKVLSNSVELMAVPLVLRHQYDFYTLEIEGVSFVGVYVQSLAMSSLKKHLKLFSERTATPILLMVEQLNATAKKYLIENHISFFSNDTIYMPRLLIYLEDAIQKKLAFDSHKKLSKLGQQLVITLIIEKKNRVDTNFVVERFDVSKMSASRGLNELEAFGFLTVHKKGRQKLYTLNINVIDELLAKMRNPVMQVVYISPSEVNHLTKLCRSGYSALSYYTNITTQSKVLAIEKKLFDTYKKEVEVTTYDVAYEQEFIKVELWRYAPIVYEDVVDPFSLYLSLKDDVEDERTQDAMSELYKILNRMLDDTRD